MADVKSFEINGTELMIKDEYARQQLDNIANQIGDETKGIIKDINDLKQGGTVISNIEPMENDMPKVFFTGDKPTSKTSVYANIEYISKTKHFNGYVEIKCQGTSSMGYPKKNYTIKMFTDNTMSTKLKQNFKNWGEQNKFCLKANYIDHSHARNIVSAKLWGQIVKTRTNYNDLPLELRESPNQGAIDGFPIKVYYNGSYEGIYTWNIPKDGWLFNMSEDNTNHCVLCAEGNNNGDMTLTRANQFRALANLNGTGGDFSVEFPNAASNAMKTSFNNFITCVKDTDDNTFKNTLNNYADVQSLIDYYIFSYVICHLDGLGQNMIMMTYDGIKWLASMYDMDSTFGLWWNGTKFVATDYQCPEQYQENNSLLWQRIESCFVEEIKSRYAELRINILSYSNIVTIFERFMDVIGKDLYGEDGTIYTGIPSQSTNNIKQIRNYIRDRLTYVDAQIEELVKPIPCTGITLDNSELTIDATISTTATLTITVTPNNCTESVIWETSDSSIATIDNGVVTAKGNGNATITVKCGNYSASCDITVSGIEQEVVIPQTNLLTNEMWKQFTISNASIKDENSKKVATYNGLTNSSGNKAIALLPVLAGTYTYKDNNSLATWMKYKILDSRLNIVTTYTGSANNEELKLTLETNGYVQLSHYVNGDNDMQLLGNKVVRNIISTDEQNITNMSNGYLTGDGEVTTAISDRVSSFIEIPTDANLFDISALPSAISQISISFYDANKTCIDSNLDIKTGDFLSTKEIMIPENTKYIRYSLKYSFVSSETKLTTSFKSLTNEIS